MEAKDWLEHGFTEDARLRIRIMARLLDIAAYMFSSLPDYVAQCVSEYAFESEGFADYNLFEELKTKLETFSREGDGWENFEEELKEQAES